MYDSRSLLDVDCDAAGIILKKLSLHYKDSGIGVFVGV